MLQALVLLGVDLPRNQIVSGKPAGLCKRLRTVRTGAGLSHANKPQVKLLSVLDLTVNRLRCEAAERPVLLTH